ncbi:Gfo/Idh/MocA family oxidoreductase [Aliarcobacter butzleri]|uniref:Gfo/Idh/MocA family protein n=1 Tax=Aliarcobacter butzleri TaxID=28197 RepID=UPI0024DEC186|nr:Gfo/Idh/MocA family oxidoreductase [Aliarcobacter butzleri]MDK2070751.1 Gfo/Idh/MocA family oxidoreductase [Aliarcobacter butzleri]
MINIGLIGFGYWGPNVAKNIHANKDLNLYSICDYKEDRLEKAKSIYIEQTTYETDYKKLLENKDIQAIAIAVETSGHYNLVKEALRARKHVYVEKPFTATVKEAEELQKLAKELNLIIHVDHIMIFHPAIRKVKKLIESKDLGDILYIDAMRMNLGQIKKDVSAMWDLAVHDLSIIDYLMDGKEPSYIKAVGEKYYNPKESLCFLTLKYDGFISNIQSSWISPLKERKMIIVGTKKMVVFDDMNPLGQLTIYDKGFDVISGENFEYDDYAVKSREGDIEIPYIKREDALFNSIEHFRASIVSKKESISNPSQAIRLLKILEIADENMNK